MADKVKSLPTILRTLRAYKSAAADTSPAMKPPTLANLFPGMDFIKVRDLPSTTVEVEIKSMIKKLNDSLRDGTASSISFPSRGAQNQLYVSRFERIVLKRGCSTCRLSKDAATRKVTLTVTILHLILDLLSKKRHSTKQDLYYSNSSLFEDQKYFDDILDNICCMLGCTRSSLNINGCKEGMVVGNLIYSDKGHTVDCTKVSGGHIIPPIYKVGDMQSNALFILVVEKHATYTRLAEDEFYQCFPCIIVTGKEQPDVGTRQFLRKIKMDLKLPVFALVDGDPYRLHILSVYRYGSKNMSYDNI